MNTAMEFEVLSRGAKPRGEFYKEGILGGGYYYDGSPEATVAKKLMKDGLLQNSPVNNWHIYGWALTKKGESRLRSLIKEIRDSHGHVWESDSVGQIDSFAYEIGYHNGFKCVNCGYEFCKHCLSEADIPKCAK